MTINPQSNRTRDNQPCSKPGAIQSTAQIQFNTALSKTRAAVEHAIAHLKTWRMLSEEGERYRPPISKYTSLIKAITGPYFFATYE